MALDTPKTTALFTQADWDLLGPVLRLSDRELQILQCVFAHLKDPEIAQELRMSPHTLRTHFERLYRKLGVNSRPEMLVRVFEEYLKQTRSLETDPHLSVAELSD